MNRRDFVKTGLCAAAAASFPELFAQTLLGRSGKPTGGELSPLERDLMKETLAFFEAANPIDPKTGRRKYISFGFVTDLHKCKRVPGDDDPKKPIRDHWYESGCTLTAQEPSLRLLGAVAHEAKLDAIINGGDLSTANPPQPLTEAEYLAEIANMKTLFGRYLPKDVPFFTVDGNHDRCYKQIQLTDEAWRKVQESLNSDVSKNPEVEVTMHRDFKTALVGRDEQGVYSGNSYHIDFRRLFKSRGYNVRVVMLSQFDRTPGKATCLRGYDATTFYDPKTQKLYHPEKTPENTIVGFVAHGGDNAVPMVGGGYLTAGSRCGNSTCHIPFKWNLGTHRGRGFFGMVAGHLHQSLVKPFKDLDAATVHVTRCYSTLCASSSRALEMDTKRAYRFSVFVLDTDSGKMKEIRLAGDGPVVSETGIARPSA